MVDYSKAPSVLIIGARENDVELIELLCKSEKVRVVGVSDKNIKSPGIELARSLNIPTSTDYMSFLVGGPVDIVFDLTDDPAVHKDIELRKSASTELHGGSCCRFLEKLFASSIASSEPRYKSVFENMLSGVAYHSIITDKNKKPIDYIFLEVNKAFEKIIGIKKDEIIGKRLSEILPSIKSSMFDWINFYGTVASSGKEVEFEQYLKDLGRWYSVSAYSPKKGYFITIYNDITARKRAEESLRKAYDTLKKTQAQLLQTEKMQVVGKLASGVAHEVKNPLAIVLQGADYMTKKMKKKNKDIVFVLDSMKDAIIRANDIINDLLDFSRVSNLKMVPEDINSIIENALLLVKNDLKRNSIEIIKEYDNSIGKINLDKNRILQVFINILMNSIDAIAGNGKIKIVTSSKKKRGKQVAVTVKIEDTGTGIPEEIADKIFDPFFTTKEAGKGTGLGLPIVKSIVEGHNGQIRIENRKGAIKGARIIMEFSV